MNEYKQILYSLESKSEHPLADAVVSNLKTDGITPTHDAEFESLTGRRVKGIFSGIEYFIGNRRLIDENKINVSPHTEALVAKLQAEAKTVVYFADNQRVLATIAIADKIKATSKAAIEELQNKGIDVYMLSGDNE